MSCIIGPFPEKLPSRNYVCTTPILLAAAATLQCVYTGCVCVPAMYDIHHFQALPLGETHSLGTNTTTVAVGIVQSMS